MAEQAKRSAAKLFNNPVLSDVKIKQVYNGRTREYYAHKFALCMQSEYFINMFTGSFKEASDNVIELHDDDPEQFEVLLRFIYTNEYDKDAVGKLASGDAIKRILIPIGIHAIADKYDVLNICKPTAEDAKTLLEELKRDDSFKVLQAIIEAHYGGCSSVDGQMGSAIANVLLTTHRLFKTKPEFVRLVREHPVLGADIALAVQRDSGDLDLQRQSCSSCRKLMIFDGNDKPKYGVLTIYCTHCAQKQAWRGI